MADKPYIEQGWFEAAFLAACCLVLFFLFYALRPHASIDDHVVQMLGMAKLFASGRFLDAFHRFNIPPVYPLLMALIIKLKHSSELTRLVESFHLLNLILCMGSAILVHFFVRRQLSKYYAFIITALYVLAPSTLEMAWMLNPQMTYMVFSMGTLLAIDISLSQESVLGGQLSRSEILICGAALAGCILSWQVGYLMLFALFFVMLKRFGLKKSATVISGIMLCISPFIGRDVFYVLRDPSPHVQPVMTLLRTMNRDGVFRTVERYSNNVMKDLADQTIGYLNLGSLDRVAKTPRRTMPNRIGFTEKAWVRWLIGIVAIVGAYYGLSQYTGIGAIYLCIYVVSALILFPNAGLSLALVLPLLLFYLYYGILQTGQWLQKLDMPMLARLVVPVLTVWIMLCTITNHIGQARGHGGQRVGQAGEHLPRILYMNTSEPPENRLEEAQTDSAHRRAMDWLKKHTPESARVAAARPEASKEWFRTENDPEKRKAIRKELSQYDYLLEEDMGRMDKAKKVSGLGMNLVYEDVPGRIRIWQVRPPGA